LRGSPLAPARLARQSVVGRLRPMASSRRHIRSVLLAFSVLAAVAAPAAGAGTRAPRLISVHCWPATSCQRGNGTVAPLGTLRLSGRHLGRRPVVSFAMKPGGRRGVHARLVGTTRALVAVPARARTGRIYVRAGRLRSNSVGPIHVRLAVTTQKPKAAPTGTAFDGNGMWIWQLPKSQGGDPAAIVAQAQAHAVRTVFVKSSDGTTWWPQFSPALLAALKAGGLRVCAWQFVYGTDPVGEAAVGAQAVSTGADCLVVDAETVYEGRYGQAQQYVAALRGAIGPNYPVGLTSFPYVDYHPALPYSVFLAPGAAQFNLPQVYWKAIGTTVDTAMSHTYADNPPYGRPIMPLGQLYDNPSTADVLQFRSLVPLYGSAGVSWWDWQEATPDGWNAVSAPLATFPTGTVPAWVTLVQGDKGDLVVWAQEHLAGAGQAVTVSGTFDAATTAATGAFETAAGLPVTGQVDEATWRVLLRYPAAAPDWTVTKSPRAAAATVSGAADRTGPPTAWLRARRDEVPGGPSR
jgi:hypothetical protein